eukprot:COSAG06_NODE_1912_length_8077_cov_102.258586_6_plen_130_part_00
MIRSMIRTQPRAWSGAENASFASFLYKTMIVLPRQARDKHRESAQKKPRVFCSGCNFTSPCCHHTANFTWELGPVCEAGVTEPRYCPAPKLGGTVGEGVGCDLTLSCEAGQTITGVEFADWGLPYADGR